MVQADKTSQGESLSGDRANLRQQLDEVQGDSQWPEEEEEGDFLCTQSERISGQASCGELQDSQFAEVDESEEDSQARF